METYWRAACHSAALATRRGLFESSTPCSASKTSNYSTTGTGEGKRWHDNVRIRVRGEASVRSLLVFGIGASMAWLTTCCCVVYYATRARVIARKRERESSRKEREENVVSTRLDTTYAKKSARGHMCQHEDVVGVDFLR
jgi:hypothetical protein